MDKAKLNKSDITHAGGIVIRVEDNTHRYLVITAKKNQEHWVFPKGHIESGENHSDTAVREVLEEAGIEARLLEPIDIIRFKTDHQEVITKFYLMAYVADREKSEEREQRWLSYKEALEILTFEDAKELLSLAERRLHHLYIA